MREEIIAALLTAGGAILLALIGRVTEAVVKKVGDDEFGKELGNFAYLADVAVMAIEQLAKHDETIKKFDEAKDYLIALANEYNIKITDVMADSFVEAAVKRMNDAGLGNNDTEETLEERTERTKNEIAKVAKDNGLFITKEMIDTFVEASALEVTDNE